MPRAASEKNASGRWCSRKRPPSENTALRKEWAACTSTYMNDAPAEAQGATQAADRYINATSALAGACIAADASALRGARMRLAETVRTMASTKLVAACLVRDAGSYLERNLLAMLEMGRAFAAFRLLYLENDSADDGTRDILRRLERTSQPPGTVRGLMLNNAANATSFALCPRSQARRNCAARLSLLSHLRQRLLELARTVLREDAFDALLLFDADFVSFSKAAYLRSLALGKLMGASAIFALSTYKATPSGKLMPYDRGILPTAFSAPKALEAIQQSPARCALGKMTPAHTAWPASIAGTPAVRHTTCGAAPCRAAVLPSAVDLSVVCAHAHIRPTRLHSRGGYLLLCSPRACFCPRAVRVRSAFGSFGTYYLPLTPDANYTATAQRFTKPRGKRAWTEHAPFNMAIAAAQGRTRPLLLDPSFRPTYLYASGEYWDYLGGRQPRRIPAAPVRDPREPWTWCPPTTLCEDAARRHTVRRV